MITILYDTASELENLKEFFSDYSFGCCDFSDALSPFNGDCDGKCKDCRQRFIETCIISRTDYNSMDFLSLEDRSCNTCANSPICWLSSTAAAPAPCRHYIKEG